MQGSSKKEKGLMDTDNSVVIAGREGGGGRGYKGINGNEKHKQLKINHSQNLNNILN